MHGQGGSVSNSVSSPLMHLSSIEPEIDNRFADELSNQASKSMVKSSNIKGVSLGLLRMGPMAVLFLGIQLAISQVAMAQPELTPEELQSLGEDGQADMVELLGGTVGERQSQIPEAMAVTPVTPAAAVAAPRAEAAIEEDAQQRQQQDDVTSDQV